MKKQTIDNIYHLWQIEFKEGNINMANYLKEKYRQMVLKSLERPYRYYNEKIKQFPPIILN